MDDLFSTAEMFSRCFHQISSQSQEKTMDIYKLKLVYTSMQYTSDILAWEKDKMGRIRKRKNRLT